MFESLSDKLHDVFRKLRGQSTLTEANITDAMREIRLALLDADVNIKIASEFIEGVKAECVGQEAVSGDERIQRRSEKGRVGRESRTPRRARGAQSQ